MGRPYYLPRRGHARRSQTEPSCLFKLRLIFSTIAAQLHVPPLNVHQSVPGFIRSRVLAWPPEYNRADPSSRVCRLQDLHYSTWTFRPPRVGTCVQRASPNLFPRAEFVLSTIKGSCPPLASICPVSRYVEACSFQTQSSPSKPSLDFYVPRALSQLKGGGRK